MKLMTRVFFYLVFIWCSSCSDHGEKVQQDELIGKYVFQIWDQDTIEVNSDGTYLHYNTFNGKHIENSGTWTYDSITGYAEFDNYSGLTDQLPRGLWHTRVRSKENEIHFIYASDIYKGYYLKIDSVDRSDKEVLKPNCWQQ
jgi:hypothetical protein